MTPESIEAKIDAVLHKNREHIHLASVPRTPLEALMDAEGGGDEEDQRIVQDARLDAFRAFLDCSRSSLSNFF